MNEYHYYHDGTFYMVEATTFASALDIIARTQSTTVRNDCTITKVVPARRINEPAKVA